MADLLVPSHVAAADEHDVARPWSQTLILHGLDQFRRRDLVSGDW